MIFIETCVIVFLFGLEDNSFLGGSARGVVAGFGRGVPCRCLRLGVYRVMVVAAEQIDKVELARVWVEIALLIIDNTDRYTV